MSDSLPKLRVGDKIRIMQTSRMEAAGLANHQGRIDQISSDQALVTLRVNGRRHLIPLSSLMKIDKYVGDWRLGVRVKDKYGPSPLRSDGDITDSRRLGVVKDVIRTVDGERLVIQLYSGQEVVEDPDRWVTA